MLVINYEWCVSFQKIGLAYLLQTTHIQILSEGNSHTGYSKDPQITHSHHSAYNINID